MRVGRPAAARWAEDGDVTDPELLRRAQNAGIATDYYDWRGQYTEVPEETLLAILGVLEQPLAAADFTGGQPEQPADGPADGSGEAGEGPRIPGEQQWGFTVQLYSLRSADSWGHGDLRDLAELARWSAAELGAGFVLINPLHAAEPVPPVSASPYLPMTRMFTSPLYLRVEDIPEYQALSPAAEFAIQDLAAPLRAASATGDLIDRDAVWTAKRAALELVSKAPLSPPRQAAYERFKAARGAGLRLWSAWCALAEIHGADWRAWPAELADPGRACRVIDDDARLRRAADFHAWLQWHCDEQLAAAQQAATSAGMTYGIIHDLAVGVHPGGADAWAAPGLLVQGFSVGAPPDGFNQLGQNWAQPPWHPRRLAAAGYRPLADLFGAALRHGGGLRVDHVMGLMRLWWVPEGQAPDRGAYVYYDHRASVAALTGCAAQAGAVAIGEDLGTVEDWVRGYLAEQGVLGTMMLWFARDHDGRPLLPEHFRRGCMATVGTHDVPPVSGFFTGDQVTVRAKLGLLTTSEAAERGESAAMLARWETALREAGLLRGDQPPDAAQFTVGLYGYLKRTPSLLLGVSLADAVGEVRTQNVPGTDTEYPNWKVPLCDAAQRPVLLEQLPGIGLLREVCRAVSPG
jgi:4-alpha-glucanotransferase